jgi:tRNA dimethylallyltransferase
MTITPNLIAICGPNASGKTRLGVEIASMVNGEIISVDSRQIYRGLDLGSGKELSEYQTPSGSVPYHLIDIAEASQIYTLYHYQRDFYRAFVDILGRNRIPVAVGGTGLYLEAVIKHYDIPKVAEDPALRNQLMEMDKESLVAYLKNISQERYELTDKSSKKRIIRGIEVALQGETGNHQTEKKPEIKPLVLAIRWDRQILRDRIRKRLMARLEQGMVDEVKGLIDKGVTRERLDLLGLEYRHIAGYLFNEVSYETMVEELYRDICRFAKRQDTYFRGMERRGIPVEWVDDADMETAKKIVISKGFTE